MRILIIFVLFVTLHYANNTNLKNLKHGCNYFPKMYVDEPSVFGNFNIMKLIPLYNKKKEIIDCAKVDDSDYDLLMANRWFRQNGRHTFYARRKCIIDGKSTEIKMHRAILNVTDTNTEVDHKDGDGLNNQRDNIRPATRSQNKWNTKAQKGASKYKGVSPHSRNQKRIMANGEEKTYYYPHYWAAELMVNGKKYRLGIFKLEEDAAKAVDKKAKELHGEFANLNFKEDGIKS